MKLKMKIETILKDLPFTRNCDKSLSIEIWKRYYPSFTKGGKISLEKLHYLPSIRDIARYRAIIQHNECRLAPTCYKVAKDRNMKRGKWEKIVKDAA
jgi:hypothetical protein